MPELQLSFHGTFALKKDDLLKIIKAAVEEKGINDTKQNLIERTGLGNEKVSRIKGWSTRCGLVDRSTGKLTTQGAIVLTNDPYLESPVTDWLMHFHLSFGDKGLASPPADPAEWGGWTWFVYDFLLNHQTFTRQELESYAGSVFEKATKNLSKDLNILLRAYTEPHALSGFGFLRSPEKDKFVLEIAKPANEYLYAYFLAQLWQRDFSDINSVQTREIFEQNLGLIPVLGINSDKLQVMLDKIEVLGLIEQNRAVQPAETIRRWIDPLELLEKAYAYQRL